MGLPVFGAAFLEQIAPFSMFVHAWNNSYITVILILFYKVSVIVFSALFESCHQLEDIYRNTPIRRYDLEANAISSNHRFYMVPFLMDRTFYTLAYICQTGSKLAENSCTQFFKLPPMCNYISHTVNKKWCSLFTTSPECMKSLTRKSSS